jgi:hypothetical protein
MSLFPGLTDSQAAALVETAKAINTDPLYLWEVINFESRHNPLASNPKSSAKGLVQFMDKTAVGMGYTSSQDLINKNPTYEGQMRGPVKRYFLGLGSSFRTRQSLFMAVFMPVARNVHIDTTMQSIYEQNPKNLGGLVAYNTKFVPQNPGIKTVADYVNFVAKAAKRKSTNVAGGAIVGGGIVGVTILALVAAFLLKGGRP